ncbi:hypothetical protein INQ51_18800 [Maribellus sp. CM-23]|uniref:hypothetical protein n=1 Tax=Maribellus sp. CM-23 TaxID=2781026 RepID=UPI001F1771BD|nr:hypothetical protein [Maribellus sp. CM-23]MCE4566376.1 hypothetical protein [Maribellus sp. CM-23]
MKLLKYISIILLFLTGCNAAHKNSLKEENNLDDSVLIEGAPNYFVALQNKFDSIEEFFPHQHFKKYDCSLLERYVNLDGYGLTAIDSLNCHKVFGSYQNEFGGFNQGYWFSFERQIHDFYPITVLQYIGIAERPLVMVLFDKHGDIVNSFPVADFYGESGGCLSSEFLNDSTLLQNYEWHEISYDAETNKDTIEIEYKTQHLTILSSGEIEIKEIKNRKK